MSTKTWTDPNDKTKRYEIGTRQKEPAGKNESGQENDISAFDLTIPTYGAWAGPSWSDDHRVTKDSTINWSAAPCKNELIMVKGADPDKCNSLIDASCWSKHVACSETFRFKLQA